MENVSRCANTPHSGMASRLCVIFATNCDARAAQEAGMLVPSLFTF